MQRILYVNGGIMHQGGIESYMMNYYRNLDRNRIQIDFIVHGYEEGVYDEEIRQFGGEIYHVPVKSKHPIKNYIEIYKICKSGRYKIIHSHMDAMSYVPLKIAKKCGIPVRIAHSHNTNHLTNNKIKILMNEYARKHLPKVANQFFACSMKAGKWLFGKDNIDEIQVIPNAIDVSKFIYNEETRKKIRNELNFDDMDIVIGHVGRFEYQKNHDYLIDIFREVHKLSGGYKLVLIGNGSLKEHIKEKVNEYDLTDYVKFIDACSNVNEYYNAFDLICMPSHFEGLSVVMIEAQCNGLKCLTSNTTSKETDITGNVTFLPIDESDIDKWVSVILSANCKRDVNAPDKVNKAGYSIKEAANKLQKTYEDLLNNSNWII